MIDGSDNSSKLPQLRRELRWLLAIIVILAGLNSTVWSLTISPGGAPDEPNHFSVANFTAENGRVPEFGVDEGMGVEIVDPEGSRVANYSYAGVPQLPYIASALLIALPTDSEWMDYHQGRAINAVWLSLTVLLAFALARELSRSNGVGLSAATMTAAWPQLTFVSAYVNTDMYTIMAGTGLMWAWWRLRRRAWDVNAALTLGLFAGLVAQGKLTAYILLALSVIVVASTLRGTWRFVLDRLVMSAAAFAVTAGWWFAIAVNMYGSDVFAIRRGIEIGERLDVGDGSGRARGLSFWEMLMDGQWINITSKSFVGTFGWMTLPISGWLLSLVAGVLLMGAVGVAMALTTSWRSWRPQRGSWSRHAVAICTFAPIVLMPILAMRSSYTLDFQAQGRYLFTALVPLLALVALGIQELGSTPGRRIALLTFVAGAVALTNVASFVDTLSPGYEQPVTAWFWHWQSAIVMLWIGASLSLTGSAVYAWVTYRRSVTPAG